jgi:predicted amidohydrolase
MTKMLVVAVGQMTGLLQNTDANITTACLLSTQAACLGARLIVLPEGCLTGNALSRPDQQATLPVEPDAFTQLRATAMAEDIVISAGFVTRCDEKFNVVQANILPDGQVLFQRKAARATTEPPFLVPWHDSTRVAFTVDGVRIVVVICSEMGSPAVHYAVTAAAPHLVLHTSAGRIKEGQHCECYQDGEGRRVWESMRRVVERGAKATAAHGIPRVGANPIGFDGETYWPGNSFGVDAHGVIRLWMPGTHLITEMRPSVAIAEFPVEINEPLYTGASESVRA